MLQFYTTYNSSTQNTLFKRTLIHLDMLKRPIAVGDTILTKGYGQCAIREQFTVVKLYKEHVGVVLSDKALAWRIRNTKVPNARILRRFPYECIVVNEQLAYNKSTWPEQYL